MGKRKRGGKWYQGIQLEENKEIPFSMWKGGKMEGFWMPKPVRKKGLVKKEKKKDWLKWCHNFIRIFVNINF